jgi:hypothetical protein
VEVLHDAVEAPQGAVKAQHNGVEAHIGNGGSPWMAPMEANLGAMQACHGAIEAHHGTVGLAWCCGGFLCSSGAAMSYDF